MLHIFQTSIENLSFVKLLDKFLKVGDEIKGYLIWKHMPGLGYKVYTGVVWNQWTGRSIKAFEIDHFMSELIANQIGNTWLKISISPSSILVFN